MLEDYQHRESATDREDYDYDEAYIELPPFAAMAGHRKGIPESKWSELVKNNKPAYEILSEKMAHDKSTDTYTFDALVSRKGASQAIKYHILVRPDGQLTLETLVDRNYDGGNRFLEKTMASVAFTGKPERSVFDDKFNVFLADAMSDDDTIRSSALRSVYALEIEPKHIERLEQFLDAFAFTDEEEWAANELLEKLSNTDEKRAIPFLTRFYRRDNVTASQQLKILSCLARTKAANRYQTISELMEEDLPLTDNEYEIDALFSHAFTEDLTNSRELFPAILQFYGTEEYRMPVISFCVVLREKGYIKDKPLRAMSKTVLINANSEYKRVVNRKRKSDVGEETMELEQTEELLGYIDLLYLQAKDKKIAAFLDKCRKLDVAEINDEFLRLDVVEGKNKAVLADALKNDSQRFLAIQLMLQKGDKSYENTFSDDEIALAVAHALKTDAQRASTKQVHRETVRYNQRDVTFYFFEIVTKNDYDDETQTRLQPIAFAHDGTRIDPGAYLIGNSLTGVDQDQLAGQYRAIVDRTLYGWHVRSSFAKIDQNQSQDVLIDY
jgi:hypothetical protein